MDATEFTPVPSEQLADELRTALVRDCERSNAAVLAESLLRHATGTTELVALDADGDRAVYRSTVTACVSARPVGESAVDDERGAYLGKDEAGLAAVADRDLAWVHPSYRDRIESRRKQ